MANGEWPRQFAKKDPSGHCHDERTGWWVKCPPSLQHTGYQHHPFAHLHHRDVEKFLQNLHAHHQELIGKGNPRDLADFYDAVTTAHKHAQDEQVKRVYEQILQQGQYHQERAEIALSLNRHYYQQIQHTKDIRRDITNGLQQYHQVIQQLEAQGKQVPKDMRAEMLTCLITGYIKQEAIDFVAPRRDNPIGVDSKTSAAKVTAGRVEYAEKAIHRYAKVKDARLHGRISSYAVWDPQGVHLIVGWDTRVKQTSQARIVDPKAWREVMSSHNLDELRQQVGHIALPLANWQELFPDWQQQHGDAAMQQLFRDLTSLAGQGDERLINWMVEARKNFQKAERVMKKNKENLQKVIKEQADTLTKQEKKGILMDDPESTIEVLSEVLREKGYNDEQIEKMTKPLREALLKPA
jgi:hypothetical protein